MNGIPNMSGISYISNKPQRRRLREATEAIKTVNSNKINHSEIIHDVDLLVTDYNDKAFIYKSGQVDVIKNGIVKTINFKTKKDAALYLMKTGWKYVR